LAKKLDTPRLSDYARAMPRKAGTSTQRSVAETVRDRVDRGGARLWKYHDFQDLPQTAVAKALSRLTQEGFLQRVAKGVYYRPTPSSFGPSMPSASAVMSGSIPAPVYPAGLSAANALGLTTQNPYRAEFATAATGPPAALREFIVHVDRPASRNVLSAEEGAILEVLRDRAASSDLPADETAKRLLRLLADEERFKRLTHAAEDEPPRVRAMLGALGEELKMSTRLLNQLKKSLNPLSRYDFGRLRSLRYARNWQAK
jgi:hypothetical protein